jgi:hypothetical protein
MKSSARTVSFARASWRSGGSLRRDGHSGSAPPESLRAPYRPVENMATTVGLGFACQLAYRVQSQSDVHATPLASDSCFEELPDGTVRLLPAPVHGLWNWDQYALGAHVLLDLLATVAEHLPMLTWRTGLAGVRDALESSRASDPNKHADPEAVVRASGLQSVSTEADEDDAAEPEGGD